VWNQIFFDNETQNPETQFKRNKKISSRDSLTRGLHICVLEIKITIKAYIWGLEKAAGLQLAETCVLRKIISVEL